MSKTIRTRIYHPNAGLNELIADDPDTLGIVRTMRLQLGESIGVFNGNGYENIYSLQSIEKRLLTAKLRSREINLRDPQVELTVLLASTKGKTKDQMVKELTALGTTRIVFYHAVRSVSLPDEKKTDHLQQAAIEACRQCERSTIPIVEVTPHQLQHVETELFSNQLICFYEKSNPEDLPAINDKTSPVTLVFGPEGGFVDEEIDFLKQNNAQLCSLGRRILRAELAVSVGAALVQFQRGGL